MQIEIPEVSTAERTPLVRRLLDVIAVQQQLLQQLCDEIARLKGLKPRPALAPSTLEPPARPPVSPGQKRPGSAKRSKNAHLPITREVVVAAPDVPAGSAFKGYEDFVTQ